MKELFKINGVPVVYREHLLTENLQIIKDISTILNNHISGLSINKSKYDSGMAQEALYLTKLNDYSLRVIDSKVLSKIEKMNIAEEKAEANKYLHKSYEYLNYLKNRDISEKLILDDFLNFGKNTYNKNIKIRKFGSNDYKLLNGCKYIVKTDLNMTNHVKYYLESINTIRYENKLMYSIIYSWLIMYLQPFNKENITIAYSNIWSLVNRLVSKSVVPLIKSLYENSTNISIKLIECDKYDKNSRLKMIDITEYINEMLLRIIEALKLYNINLGTSMITSMSKEDLITRVRLSDKISYIEMIYGLLSGNLVKTEFCVEIDLSNTNNMMINYTSK